MSKFNDLYRLILQQFNNNFSNIPENIRVSDQKLKIDLLEPWLQYNRSSSTASINTLLKYPFYYKVQDNAKTNMYNSLGTVIAFWFNDEWFKTRYDYLKSESSNQQFVYSDISKNNRQLAAVKFDMDLILNEGTPNFNYQTTQYIWNRIKFDDKEVVNFIYAISNIWKYSQVITQEQQRVTIKELRQTIAEYIQLDRQYFGITIQKQQQLYAIIDNISAPIKVIGITIMWLLNNFTSILDIGNQINIKELVDKINIRKKTISNSDKVQQENTNIKTISRQQFNILKQLNSNENSSYEEFKSIVGGNPNEIFITVFTGRNGKDQKISILHKKSFYNTSVIDFKVYRNKDLNKVYIYVKDIIIDKDVNKEILVKETLASIFNLI